MVGELSHSFDESLVVGDDHSGISVRAQVLSGVEAEGGPETEGAGAPALPCGAVRLCGIFQHLDAVGVGDLADRVHRSRMTVEVHGNDHLRPGRDGSLEPFGVHGEGHRVDVDPHGFRVVQQNRLAGRDERVGDRDDLVVPLDAKGPERERQRVGAIRHAARVPDAAVFRERGLELAAFLAAHELGGLHDTLHGGVDLCFGCGDTGP